MTITTVNNPKNPKNDSDYARHRSTWKKDTNVIDTVLTNLRGAQSVTYKANHYYGTPEEVRDYWDADFGNPLPDYAPRADHIIVQHYSGVDTWLAGTHGGPLQGDMQLIWADFARIFAKRSNPGTIIRGTIIDPAGTTQELLFICHTFTHFDLIYSKWGFQKGHHFYHWTSVVGAPATERPGIDVLSDDPGG
jgi:hypothetical protein